MELRLHESCWCGVPAMPHRRQDGSAVDIMGQPMLLLEEALVFAPPGCPVLTPPAAASYNADLEPVCATGL